MKKTALLVPLLLGGSLAAFTVDASASTRPVSNPPIPAASLAPCTDLPALPTARCGSIRVDLDRSHPSRGKTTVAFAVVPRTDQS